MKIIQIAIIQEQLASASPRASGENVQKSRQSNPLTAFRISIKIFFSRNPIFFSNRRVSTIRSWERLARAARPSTIPTETRSGCIRMEVVSGTTKHASGPNPLKITHGRTNHSPLPFCSVPIFTPNRHHQISRTVYRRGSSASVRFLTSFHASKSFCIQHILSQFQNKKATWTNPSRSLQDTGVQKVTKLHDTGPRWV